MIYDEIANGSRVPVNKTASDINSGDRFESRKKIQTADSETPIPSYQSEYDGRRFGRFTVIGKHEAGKYVVRCDCGIYTIRRSKAIRNPKNDKDCCERCREVIHLQSKHGRTR